jgi:hypothetical protein
LRRPKTARQDANMNERDEQALLEATFDIRRDVARLVQFSIEEDDGEEGAEEEDS